MASTVRPNLTITTIITKAEQTEPRRLQSLKKKIDRTTHKETTEVWGVIMEVEKNDRVSAFNPGFFRPRILW